LYSTVMVYLDPFVDNTRLLQVAGGLAERFDASVLGVSGGRLLGVAYDIGGLPGGVIDTGREELDEALEATREAALAILQRYGRHVEWRSIVNSGPLQAAAVIRETRGADLVIVAANYRESLAQGMPRLDTDDLVMQSGRPVLIVPPAVARLHARNVLVAWKDSREARRAVSDALPLLQTADRVLVVQVARQSEIGEAREAVADVLRWLKRHGATAEGKAVSERGRNALQLDSIAKAEDIDLIVAGAYGHSRLREWVLGGVTRNLLLYGDRCALVSH
jgi:nucleotide-binding universal stress UspA family protein